MTSMVTISFTLDTTDASAALGFEAWIDDRKCLDVDHVQKAQQVVVELEDTDSAEHELRLVLKNKTVDHTQIDEHGNILTDARIIVSDVAFDEIQLEHLFGEHTVYTHNFNGTSTTIQTKCYGEMGCNGTVSLKFTTPVYLWLLEYM